MNPPAISGPSVDTTSAGDEEIGKWEQAVFRALSEGDAEKLSKAMAHNPRMDIRDEDGWSLAMLAVYATSSSTPLLEAALAGQAACAKLLIELGCDMEARDFDGSSPALRAAEMGHAETLAILLAAGANARAADSRGNTIAHMAAQAKSPGCAQIASLAHCDLDARNTQGKTAAMAALEKRDAATLRALLAGGCAAKSPDPQGRDLIRLAVLAVAPECIDALAEAGLLPATDDANGGIGLFAAHMGLAPCLDALIRAGLDVDWKRPGDDADPFAGSTAAHQAAINGRAECLSILAAAGCDLEAIDAEGLSPAQAAAENGHDHCAAFIEGLILARETAKHGGGERPAYPSAPLRL